MAKLISLIIPCYNERASIGLLLDAIRRQTYQQEKMEVIIADGMSEDGTRDAIHGYAALHPELNIRLIDNPQRIIPAALNAAIEAAEGDVIIRLDAHSAPKSDYVERCLDVLENTEAANVGGVWEIKPGGEGWAARGIAAATAHPLGAGGARYRIGGQAGEVETVPFGAFRRDWLEKAGPFDETLLTNEDYEYNVRIRQAGGIVWFDPSIQSVYLARSSYAKLARQYTRYGYWKVQMLRRYPGTLLARQAIPPLFILSIMILSTASLLLPAWRPILGVELGSYFLVTMSAAIVEMLRRKDIKLLLSFPIALWVIHVSWGGAFLWALVRSMAGGMRENG